MLRFVLTLLTLFGFAPLLFAQDSARNSREMSLSNSNTKIRLHGDKTYQVSVDGKTFSREMPQMPLVKLRYRNHDPLQEGIAVTSELRANQDNRLWIVQYVTRPLQAYRKRIEALGGKVYRLIPDQAQIIEIDARGAQALQAQPFVRWVGPFHPAYKLEAELLERLADTTRGRAERYSIMVHEGGAAMQQAVAKQVGALGGIVEMTSDSGSRLEATLTKDQLRLISFMDQVLFIDRWTPPENDMDLARLIGNADYIETVEGYSGQGVRAEVMDGGLLTTHGDFQSTPPVIHGSAGTSLSHGTPVYGIVFGDGTGDINGRGMIPDAQGIFATYSTLSNRYTHTADLVDPLGTYRAVFQTNSWGNARTTAYTTISAEMDDILFQNDILILQSQSNSGWQDSRPQAWAKNIVSVGGVYHNSTLNKSDDTWNNGASTGLAADGRVKPDLSHFYDATYAPSSSGTSSYTQFGGTSGATPITAGHFGIFFQMWADGVFAGGPGAANNVFDSRPHMTTAKAMMINTAAQYDFSGATADLTRSHQGWGMADVRSLYEASRSNGWSLPVVIDESEVLAPLDVYTKVINVTGNASDLKWLKATLVYAEPQGNPSASQQLVNDLSLRLTSPSGTTVYWGNNGLDVGPWSTSGGSANTIDNVENVFIEEAELGNWTIQVFADSIVQDSHLETAAMDADFALVVSRGGTDNVDLYMKDSAADIGAEPNTQSGGDIWLSPDLWNCQNTPGCTTHENPDYKTTSPNYIRGRIYNKGTTASQPTYVHFYWTRARSGEEWAHDWIQGSSNQTNAGKPLGAEIMNPVWVPSIPAGGSAIVTRAWFPPDPAWYQGGITTQGHPMLCLLARVVSPQDPMFDEQEPQNPIAPNIKNNNNVVTRNTYVTDIDTNDFSGKWVSALACSVSQVTSELNIHMSSISEREQAPFSEFGGRLTMQMDEEMWAGWMASGARGEGVEIVGERLISFTDPQQGAWFYGVQIGPDDCRTFAIQAEITPGVVIREQVNYAFMVEQYTNQLEVPDGAVVFEIRLNPSERQ